MRAKQPLGTTLGSRVKTSPTQLSIFLVLLALIGIYIVFRGHAAPADTANLWVDKTGGSCTRQSTDAVYNDAQACGSLNEAYQAASLGDRVYVKGGNYTGVPLIADNPAKDGTGVSPVTVQEAPGESVLMDDLATAASNITLIGFEVDHDGGAAPVGGPDIRAGSHDVTLDGIVSTVLFITGNTNFVTVKNSEFGPYQSASGSQIKTVANGGDDPNPLSWPNNTVLDNNYFHDYTVQNTGDHTDCLHIFYHIRLTAKNNRFVGCANYDILLGSNGSGSPEHDVIENNYFGPTTNGEPGFGLRGGIGEDFNDVVIRYNSGAHISTQTTNALAGVQFIANAVTDLDPCRANTYRYNIATNTNCGGAGDTQANPLFVDPSAGNFDLQPGSPAREHGDPSAYPAADRYGHVRPFGSLPDAGAYEFGSTGGTPPPTPPPPAPTPSPTPTPTPPPSGGCTPAATLGNINCDTGIDIFDLSILLSNFGKSPSQSSNPAADVNGNNMVDIFDLSILLTNYGTSGSGTVSCTGSAHTPGGSDGMGGCWPGANNTGPNAAESSMSAYTGSCTITAANVTIDSKVINCSPVHVGSGASGLVIKNSYIKGGVIQDSGSASFTIQDSLVDNAVHYNACSSPSSCSAGNYACGDPNNATTDCGIGYKNFTVLRTELINSNRAAYCESTCTIQDSYFHGTNLWPDHTNLAHASSVRNEQSLTLRHNSLGCDYTGPFDNAELGCSADMSGYPDFAPIKNATIDKNLFLSNNIGAGFCVYGGGTSGKPFSNDSTNATNIKFTDNIFQRGANGKCGTYGPVTDFITGRTGNVWTNNKYDNGAVVSPQ